MVPSGLFIVLGLLAGAASGQGQALSDRRLPDGGGFALTLPVRGNAAVELAQRVLSAADVPFGIEQTPPDPSEPPPRIDSPITDRLSFDGWVLRDALDKLVALDPRYTWEESSGRIIVRAVALQHSDGLLQRGIPGFSLDKATQSTAIETLARMLVPARGPGGVFVLGVSAVAAPAGSSRSSPAASSLEYFSVSLGPTTVIEALNALASRPRHSWTVRYDAPDAAPEAATLSLITPAATTVALSNVAMARARVAAPGRLVVPVTSELASVVVWYGLRAKVQTGFIRFPGERRETRTDGFSPLDLTGLTPSAAFDRIVGLDTRYEWTRDDGMYLVRPRRDLVSGTPLDMPVDEFSARGIGTDAILGRIVRLLAIEEDSAVGAGSTWSGTVEDRDKQRTARERPLTFSARHTTVRGVLNELCKEEGTLSWRATLQPDQKRGLLITLDLQSQTGWGVSRTFVAPPWEPR